MYVTGKLGATERKLVATEELLAVAKQELAEMTRRYEDKDKSYQMQSTNTGVFWAAARAAEGKLRAIRGLVDCTNPAVWPDLAIEIRKVLDAD